jgi:hypothetical protein
MNTKAAGMGFAFAVAVFASAASAQDATNRTEPGLANRSDVLLVCDFENDDWWPAWGSRRQPVNTALVGGDKAFGGKGKSLQVTTPRGEHTGTSFAYKFRERLGAEPDEIYFRYYLKFDPDWKHATSGGKLPGISGTYGKAGWGGRKVNGSDGWSARGLFETRHGADFARTVWRELAIPAATRARTVVLRRAILQAQHARRG